MKPRAIVATPRPWEAKPRPLAIAEQPRAIRQADMMFPTFVGNPKNTTFLDRRGAPVSECTPDDLTGQTTIISTCQAPLSKIIELIIAKVGGCDELILSTWAASGEDVSNIYDLLQSAQVKTALFAVDPMFSRNAPTAAKMIVERFGAKSILLCQNHAKFAIVTYAGRSIMVRTSMNLDATTGIEYCTFDAGAIAYYVAEHMRQLFHAIPLRIEQTKDGSIEEQRKAEAVSVLSQIPNDTADSYFLSGGQYSFIDMIEALTERTGASTLHLSCWIASIPHIDRLAALKCATYCLFDKGIRKIKGGERYERLIEHFGKDSVRLTATHSKFCIIGERVAIITSANLNDNPRNEDFRVTWDRETVQGLIKLHGEKKNG